VGKKLFHRYPLSVTSGRFAPEVKSLMAGGGEQLLGIRTSIPLFTNHQLLITIHQSWSAALTRGIRPRRDCLYELWRPLKSSFWIFQSDFCEKQAWCCYFLILLYDRLIVCDGQC